MHWKYMSLQSSPDCVSSSREFTQSRSKYCGQPNTCAVAGTFAVAGHQRTDVAVRLDAATGTRRSNDASPRPLPFFNRRQSLPFSNPRRL
jgi:hypothetical protein